MAYFGVLKPFFAECPFAPEARDSVAADSALAIHSILDRHRKVQFWDDGDAQNRAMNDIDDYLYDEVKGKMGVEMSEEQMDALIEPELCRWPKQERQMSSSRGSVAHGKENIEFSLFHVDRKTLEIAVHPNRSVVVKAPLGSDHEEIRTRVARARRLDHTAAGLFPAI